MDAAELRGLLLLAAARAYLAAGNYPADAEPDWYARHLADQWARDPQGVPAEIEVSVPLGELLNAAELLAQAQRDRERAAETERELDQYKEVLRDVRSIMRGKGDTNTKSRAALRRMGLIGKPADPCLTPQYWRDEALCRRWRELTEGLTDYSPGVTHPKLSPMEALEQIGRESFPDSTDPANAARTALYRAGVRPLPRT